LFLEGPLLTIPFLKCHGAKPKEYPLSAEGIRTRFKGPTNESRVSYYQAYVSFEIAFSNLKHNLSKSALRGIPLLTPTWSLAAAGTSPFRKSRLNNIRNQCKTLAGALPTYQVQRTEDSHLLCTPYLEPKWMATPNQNPSKLGDQATNKRPDSSARTP